MAGRCSEAPESGADSSAARGPRALSFGKDVGRGEFVCGDCGYRLWRERPPERCPICRSSKWRSLPSARLAESRTPTGQADTAVDDSTLVKRQANGTIRERFPTPGDTEPIAFLCECADQGCYQLVWLAAQAYDQARSDPGWHPLVSGHAPAAEGQAAGPAGPASGDPADQGLLAILVELSRSTDEPVTTAALAEAVGIPPDYAEIVARRLERNRDRGFVERTPDGRWYATPTGTAAAALAQAGGWRAEPATAGNETRGRHHTEAVLREQAEPGDDPPPAPGIAPQLERLAELWQQGILTDEEYAEQQAQILAGEKRSRASSG